MTDTSGSVIPGVTVVVTHVETGVKRVLVTNDAGRYTAAELNPGTYSLEAELVGFKKFVREGLGLLAGDVLEMGIQLEVGEISDVVEVTGRAPLVNTTMGTGPWDLRQVQQESFSDKARFILEAWRLPWQL